MVSFQSRIIFGNWQSGYALDLHTLRSTYLGEDEFGHPRFETQRSELGELLYRLKYSGDRAGVDKISEAAEAFLRQWKPEIDLLVPVPPSAARSAPPVMLVAQSLSKRINLPLADCVKRTKDIPQLKDINDLDERLKLLEGLHSVDKTATNGKRVLLFDDLYRSGATLNAIATALRASGAKEVFALTITRTRSNQ
jgi:competence protein ComFC